MLSSSSQRPLYSPPATKTLPCKPNTGGTLWLMSFGNWTWFMKPRLVCVTLPTRAAKEHFSKLHMKETQSWRWAILICNSLDNTSVMFISCPGPLWGSLGQDVLVLWKEGKRVVLLLLWVWKMRRNNCTGRKGWADYRHVVDLFCGSPVFLCSFVVQIICRCTDRQLDYLGTAQI